MVFIDPFYNHTAGLIGDKWFSPKIGTDHALSFAIAYTWLTEGTYDKEYVATHAHGFDEWAEYVLGKTDGVPKTCEWAEEESGVPACEIRALAREWAQEEHLAGRRRPRRLGRRLPRLSRHRVGARHDRARHDAGHGQAGLQHLVDHAGHAGRLRLLLPRLRRGRHLRRLRELRRRLQVRLAHVRRQDDLPVAVEHQHVGRAAHPAPQGAGVHHGRRVQVGRQGLRRWRHPAPDAPVPVSGPRLPEDQDAVEVRRAVDRHHDRDQPLRPDVRRPEPRVRRQPVHLVRGRGAVRRHHPAGLHQLRALGHLRVRQLLRLHPRHLRPVQPSRDLAAGQVHRAGRRVQVGLRDLSPCSPRSWASGRCSPRARPISSGWSSTTTPPTCPST